MNAQFAEFERKRFTEGRLSTLSERKFHLLLKEVAVFGERLVKQVTKEADTRVLQLLVEDHIHGEHIAPNAGVRTGAFVQPMRGVKELPVKTGVLAALKTNSHGERDKNKEQFTIKQESSGLVNVTGSLAGSTSLLRVPMNNFATNAKTTDRSISQ